MFGHQALNWVDEYSSAIEGASIALNHTYDDEQFGRVCNGGESLQSRRLCSELDRSSMIPRKLVATRWCSPANRSAKCAELWIATDAASRS